MSKSTRAEVQRRVDIVYRMMLLGLDRQRIIDHIGSKYPAWGVSKRSVDTYIARAGKLMLSAGEHDRDLEFGRAVARLHDLYSIARAAKNVPAALAVVKEMIELFGHKKDVRADIAQLRQQLVDLLLEEVMGEADEITRGSAQPG